MIMEEKKTKIKESNIQSLFSKDIDKIMWEVNKIIGDESVAFELKLCKENRFSFDRVEEHQIKALYEITYGKGVYHKISDSPIYPGMKTRFTKAKPFDCFCIRGWGFVVICWYKPRKMKQLHFIDIPDFIRKKNSATMKSMTYEESKEISKMIYDL